jgi:hypothetical protein
MSTPLAPSPCSCQCMLLSPPRAAHRRGSHQCPSGCPCTISRLPRTTTTMIAPSVTVLLLLHRVCPPQLLLMLLVIRAQQRTLVYPLLALPIPTAKRRRAVSSRHRAAISAATMIPAVTVIGRWDGSSVVPPPGDDCGRGNDRSGHCHWMSGWEIAPKQETAPRLPWSCSTAAPL